MKKSSVPVLICVLLALILRCSNSGIADGGSVTDVGNPVGKGIILDKDGKPVAGAQVQLLPADLDPVASPLQPDTLIDTTDSAGRFRIEMDDSTKVYSIQAVHPTDRSCALLDGIRVSKDTTKIHVATLQQPGTIYVALADTVNTSLGYVYVKGSRFFKRYSETVIIYNYKRYLVLFDEIPAGSIPGLYFCRENEPDIKTTLTDTFSVLTEDTVIVAANMFWYAYTQSNSGLPENTVTTVFIDANGTKWLGTRNGGAVKYDGNSWVVYDMNNTLPSNRVNAFAQDADGSIWVGTAGGLTNIKGSAGQTFTKAYSGLPNDTITALAVDKKGIKWIGTARGCVKFDGTAWTVYDTAGSPLRENYITAIDINADDVKYVCTYLGFAKYGDTAWAGVYYKGDDSCAIEDTIFDISVSMTGYAHFATRKGIMVFTGTMWYAYDHQTPGVTNEVVTAVAFDTDDRLWAATQAEAVVYLADTSFVHNYNAYNTDVLATAGTIHSIAVDPDNTLYFGTENNGLVYLRFSQW